MRRTYLLTQRYFYHLLLKLIFPPPFVFIYLFFLKCELKVGDCFQNKEELFFSPGKKKQLYKAVLVTAEWNVYCTQQISDLFSGQ